MSIHGPFERRDDLVRVAYFSPLPPDTSGIADYSALLLPDLLALELSELGGAPFALS